MNARGQTTGACKALVPGGLTSLNRDRYSGSGSGLPGWRCVFDG
jgi:hypothetical protein